jgi:hypothetical protein
VRIGEVGLQRVREQHRVQEKECDENKLEGWIVGSGIE